MKLAIISISYPISVHPIEVSIECVLTSPSPFRRSLSISRYEVGQFGFHQGFKDKREVFRKIVLRFPPESAPTSEYVRKASQLASGLKCCSQFIFQLRQLSETSPLGKPETSFILVVFILLSPIIIQLFSASIRVWSLQFSFLKTRAIVVQHIPIL